MDLMGKNVQLPLTFGLKAIDSTRSYLICLSKIVIAITTMMLVPCSRASLKGDVWMLGRS